MSFHVLRALLWKDYRVHRPVLILGAVLLVLPYASGLLGLLLGGDESRAAWSPEGTLGLSYASLALSLVTLIGLASSAFAAERENRTHEFLACLPTSRWATLSSKVVLMMLAVLAIGLANLVPWSLSARHSSSGTEREMLWLLASTGALLFGAAWFVSAWRRNSTVASVCGLAAPIVVVAALQGFQSTLPLASFAFESAYQAICTTLGLVGLVAGCAVYLLRFEP